MAEAHHGEGNVGMGPEALVRRVDEEVEGPHFASQFGHCKFKTGVNMVKVLSTATAKSFTINEMACFGDWSMLNGLNIVHTTADYTALNNRLFTEKTFFIVQMAKSTAYYAAYNVLCEFIIKKTSHMFYNLNSEPTPNE